jgi:hypothetical protein
MPKRCDRPPDMAIRPDGPAVTPVANDGNRRASRPAGHGRRQTDPASLLLTTCHTRTLADMRPLPVLATVGGCQPPPRQLPTDSASR